MLIRKHPNKFEHTTNQTGNGGDGDVVGPNESVANAIARFANEDGKTLKSSPAILTDDGELAPGNLSTGHKVLVSDEDGFIVESGLQDSILSFLENIDADVQTQLDSKEDTITVLEVIRGGTGSNAVLNNLRVMVSAGDEIIENVAIDPDMLLISDGDGLPIDSVVTALEAQQLSGISTASSIQDQLDAKLSLSGGTMSGVIDMGSHKITNVTDPTSNQDAATKKYVDDNAGGSGGSTGFLSLLSFAGASSTTSSSYVDVDTNQTVTDMPAGDYLILYTGGWYNTSATDTTAAWGVRIDSTDYDLTPTTISNASIATEAFAGMAKVTLAAGSHTFKPRVKRTGGSATINWDTNSPQKMVILKAGGGAGESFPVVTKAASLGSPFDVNSQTITDTGLSIPITTTRANEDVFFSLNSDIFENTGSAHTVLLYARVDSGSNQLVWKHSSPASYFQNATVGIWLTIATPGSHTVKLRAATLEAGVFSSLIGTNSVFQIAQFPSGADAAVVKGAFTPTSNFTNCTLTGFFWFDPRSGLLRVQMRGKMTSTSASATLHLDYAACGYQRDTSMIVADLDDDTGVPLPGVIYMLDHHTANYIDTAAWHNNDTSLNLYVGTSGGIALTAQVTNTIPFTWNTDDSFLVDVSFPAKPI